MAELDPANLQDYALFKNLNATQIENLTAACDELEFEADTEIIVRGEHGSQVFFLLEGEMQVFLPSNQGERELAHLAPPAIVGEMELLTGQRRIASVRALTHVRVLGVSFETLRNRADDGDPATLKVMYNIAHALAHRLAMLVDKFSEFESQRERVRWEELDDFRRKLFSDWSFD